MFLFRADGNSDIGLGHIMRCLSIADATRCFKEHCVFAMADDRLKCLIELHGYESVVLNTKYFNMESELDQMESWIRYYKPSVLFIDSYAVTKKYLMSIRQMMHQVNGVVLYIDDLLSFAYPCDYLVNYNIYGSNMSEVYERLYFDESITFPKLLLGTLYTPLRYEFQGLPRRIVKKYAADILISTGGADSEHITVELVKAIKLLEQKFYTFHVIIGAMNQDAEKIEKLTDGISNIVLHRNVNKMSYLMQYCDVAVSAAGSTLYELCATQTPSITYILADNQMPGAEGFEKYGILKCIGDVRELGTEILANMLLESALKLCNDYNERCRIVKNMSTVVDGYGVQRILKALSCHFLTDTSSTFRSLPEKKFGPQ